MSKKKLLEEGTVRQFMKLANLKPLASTFINETYIEEEPAEEEPVEEGFFKKLGAELSGQRKKTSANASAISAWMRENDLMGKFGPLGTSGTGTRSGKGWESQNDIFDWASDNVEEAEALKQAVGEHGFVKRGFEDDPRVKAAREVHDIPRDAELAKSKERSDAYDAEMARMATNRFNMKADEERAATAAAKKKEEEEMKSFKINQAGREAQKARDERDYQERLRQKQRDSARYGTQDYDVVRKVRENMKITKSQLKHIIKEELTQVLNEMEALAPEVAGFVEKAITALTVLKKVGSDMGKYKEWAQDNIPSGEYALEGFLKADSADAVKDAARRMYKDYTRGIDFEGMAQSVRDSEDSGTNPADRTDADEIIPSLKAKPLLDKLAAILSNP